MKKILLLGLVVMLVLGMAAYVYAAVGSAKIAANGPHNMEAKLQTKVQGSSTEVCAFCHIPHRAAAALGVPLRNRTGADSAFCMTCHDGIVDATELIRQPLSGTLSTGGVVASATLVLTDHVIGGTGHVVGTTPNWAGDPKNVLVATEAIAVSNINGGAGVRKAITAIGDMKCQSCHDVHNHATDTKPFLRRSNANSGLCTSCHDL